MTPSGAGATASALAGSLVPHTHVQYPRITGWRVETVADWGRVSDSVSSPRTSARAFSCALTAVILARVRGVAGAEGVSRLLSDVGSERTVSYLEDVGNWVGFDEVVALWDAGGAIAHDLNFARHVGEDAVKVLGGSATATVLRALGSPDELLRRLDVTATRFSAAAKLETIEARAGYAEVSAVAAPGFIRAPQHCEWTQGLLSQVTQLFGLPPARVEHLTCQAMGAPDCRYFVTWDPVGSAQDGNAQAAMLEKQLDSLSKRLEGVFATAADLISSGDLEDTLARIADRAAQQVRAPKHLLAVRRSSGEFVSHQKGLTDDEASAVADRVFGDEEPPTNWCVAEIRSGQREYGRLVAMYEDGAQFFPQERELLELYARYAAAALDSATALLDARTNGEVAQRRHEEARALLELARCLASAGTSDEVASRLADAIPSVIDCDRVTVWLWNDADGELVRRAVNSAVWGDGLRGAKTLRGEDIPRVLAWLERPDAEPHFTDLETTAVKGPLEEIGAVASVSVPIATSQRFLGVVQVSVRDRAERLARSQELIDRLSGVAAHAVIALENGRLVDHITHQARHDQLTGLANRLVFGERVAAAAGRTDHEAKPFALFYIDLDRFKPVNDEFGHDVGDALLCAVAERLSNCARPEDTVARLGGDEFAVIVDAIEDASQLGPIAERFQKAFESPFVIDGHKLSVGASIGQAVWPVDATDVDGLLREADTRMYRVKRARPGGSGRGDGKVAAREELSQAPTA